MGVLLLLPCVKENTGAFQLNQSIVKMFSFGAFIINL